MVNDSTRCNWRPVKIRKNPAAIVAVRLIEIPEDDEWTWLLLRYKLEDQL